MHNSRTFLPDAPSKGHAGAEIAGSTRLTLDEATLLRHGKEDRAVEFFDRRSNRDVRAVMGSNRAPFLS